MITDAEIKQAAIESGLAALHVKHNEAAYYVTQLAKGELERFARAIYQLGQQHQMESDASLCKSHRVYTRIGSDEKYIAPWAEDGDRHEGVLFSEAILKNKGD